MTAEDHFLKAYEDLADPIFRHCYFRVFSRDRAKELSQETFLRAWQYISGGKDIDNIRAFLYRIANNLIVDESRKKKEQSLDVMQEKGFDPAQKRGVRELEAMLDGKFAREVLERCDISHREVIIMRYIDDLKPKEIAEILGESENVISVRIHRALKQLKELVHI